MTENGYSQIKDSIVELAKNNQAGISNEEIRTALPDIPNPVIADVLNQLLSNRSLGVFKTGEQLLYKYSNVPEQVETKNLNVQEDAVYRFIADAGTKGVFSRDISSKLRLNKVLQPKILKSLENRKLIKGVTITGSRLKCYLLNNLEHESTTTNSHWYENQDPVYLNGLIQLCYNFLGNKKETADNLGGGPLMVKRNSFSKASDVLQHVMDRKGNQEPLSVSNIESILYTFVIDGTAERIKDSNNEFLYKVTARWLKPPGILKTPCCGCPSINNCGKIGSITPKTCKYFDAVLES